MSEPAGEALVAQGNGEVKLLGGAFARFKWEGVDEGGPESQGMEASVGAMEQQQPGGQ